MDGVIDIGYLDGWIGICIRGRFGMIYGIMSRNSRPLVHIEMDIDGNLENSGRENEVENGYLIKSRQQGFPSEAHPLAPGIFQSPRQQFSEESCIWACCTLLFEMQGDGYATGGVMHITSKYTEDEVILFLVLNSDLRHRKIHNDNTKMAPRTR